MGNWQKMGLAVGTAVLGLGLGYLVFRPTMPEPRVASQSVMSTTAEPVRPPAPAAPAVGPTPAQLSAAKAARDAESDREARIAEIDQQFRDLPEEDPQALSTLASEIQLRRAQVTELRSRVAEIDQSLGIAKSEGGVDPEAQVALEAEATELQGKLTDAKLAVSEQLRQISYIAASNDPGFMSNLYQELARRSSIVAALEQNIAGLFGAQQSAVAEAEAARNAEVNAIRSARNELATSYNEAVDGLNDASQRYRDLVARLAESRRASAALAAEKNALQAR